MSSITFPRPRDNERFAWGLTGSEPVEIWERFSPAYEAQLERLVTLLEDMEFTPIVGGAGSEDGEYVRAEYRHSDEIVFFYHLENPADARFLSSLNDEQMREWITERWLDR